MPEFRIRGGHRTIVVHAIKEIKFLLKETNINVDRIEANIQ